MPILAKLVIIEIVEWQRNAKNLSDAMEKITPNRISHFGIVRNADYDTLHFTFERTDSNASSLESFTLFFHRVDKRH